MRKLNDPDEAWKQAHAEHEAAVADQQEIDEMSARVNTQAGENGIFGQFIAAWPRMRATTN